MDNEKKQNEQPAADRPEAAPESHPLPEELQALKDTYRKYGNHALTVLTIVLVAVAAVTFYRNRKRTGEERASDMLASARSPQELETLLARYPSASVAPLAELRLAKDAFNAGNYDGALKRYEDFQKRFAGHPMAPGAELGRIHCLEAKGQFEQARAAAAAFRAAHPDHFLAPEAVFVIARCEEQMGLLTEAKTTYENFIMADTNSAWSARAEEALELVKKKIESPAPPQAAPPAAALPAPFAVDAPPVFAPPPAKSPPEPAMKPEEPEAPAEPAAPPAEETPAAPTNAPGAPAAG